MGSFVSLKVIFENENPKITDLLERVFSNTGLRLDFEIENEEVVFIDPFTKAKVFLINSEKEIEIFTISEGPYIISVIETSLIDLGGKQEFYSEISSWTKEPFTEVKKKAGKLGLIQISG